MVGILTRSEQLFLSPYGSKEHTTSWFKVKTSWAASQPPPGSQHSRWGSCRWQRVAEDGRLQRAMDPQLDEAMDVPPTPGLLKLPFLGAHVQLGVVVQHARSLAKVPYRLTGILGSPQEDLEATAVPPYDEPSQTSFPWSACKAWCGCATHQDPYQSDSRAFLGPLERIK